MIPSKVLLFSLSFLPAGAAAAQATATTPVAAASAPSSLVRPALDNLQQALGTLRVDKWKAPGEVREATQTNLGSIRRDLDATLPPLLAGADATPASVSGTLPLLRNVDALYDVLLRVVDTAALAAPEQQSDALEGALSSLQSAHRALADRIQSAAVAQERQVISLQKQLSARPAVAPTPVCPTATPAKHSAAASRSHKTARKPAPQH